MRDGAKILVAYDGSEYADRALSEAAEIAKKFNGSVTLLHVFWDDQVKKLEGTEIRDQPTMQLLANAEKRLKASKVKYEMRSERSDDIPHVILKTVEDGGFDCIAMGSRGRGGAKAWILGSVSSRVVAESACPVIVVK
jgi:nucleotide-binding universal stress UspA family protein